ncbi:rab-GTPase-TBC domain-containing protein [Phthorimaea operculella]|nr:rab-GTPase-TBC domain-containing protein [Phthorimaea operculella]
MSSSSVEDLPDQCKDLFTQDGVLLKACMGRPITDLNSIGMLCIVQNSDNTKCIEWRPLDLITIDSDTQDQEWAVVNTIGRRQRTLSGNMTSDYATARARIIRIPLEDLKSFRVTRNNQQLQLSTKPGVWQTTLYFQHGNAEVFMSNLKNHVKSAKTRHDRNTYVVVEPNTESQVLNRSFAELDIFTENTTDVVWNLVSNFKQRPYETTMEAFSKLTDIASFKYKVLNRSFAELDMFTENTTDVVWNLVSNFKQRPYETTMEAFSKLTDIGDSFAELDMFTENTTDVVWNLVSNFKQRPYETTMEAFSKLTDIGEWYHLIQINSSFKKIALNRSFAELDMFTENTTDVVWNLVSNFKQRPYETTMEAFSKLTDIDDQPNQTRPNQTDTTEPNRHDRTKPTRPNQTDTTEPNRHDRTKPTRPTQPDPAEPTRPGRTNPTRPNQTVSTEPTRPNQNSLIQIHSLEFLNRSFAELDMFTENTTDVVWNLVSNFKQRPYETTMEAFSKLTDIVYYGNEAMNGKRDVSEEVADLLTKSMSALEDATTVTAKDEYEVVSVKPTLPPRPCIPRGTPLSTEKWEGLQDTEGRIIEVEGVKQLIFRGGVAHSIRQSVWKYLLDYYPWHATHAELKVLQKKRTEEYFSMKLQWRSMTEGQEARFSEYRDRKSLVEKDVNRTDRTHPFFAGDNNPNLVVLQDILMTYVMYNFDLGYVQGMSDILAPLLLLLGNEVDSFWCFVGFMDKIGMSDILAPLLLLLGNEVDSFWCFVGFMDKIVSIALLCFLDR